MSYPPSRLRRGVCPAASVPNIAASVRPCRRPRPLPSRRLARGCRRRRGTPADPRRAWHRQNGVLGPARRPPPRFGGAGDPPPRAHVLPPGSRRVGSPDIGLPPPAGERRQRLHLPLLRPPARRSPPPPPWRADAGTPHRPGAGATRRPPPRGRGPSRLAGHLPPSPVHTHPRRRGGGFRHALPRAAAGLGG